MYLLFVLNWQGRRLLEKLCKINGFLISFRNYWRSAYVYTYMILCNYGHLFLIYMIVCEEQVYRISHTHILIYNYYYTYSIILTVWKNPDDTICKFKKIIQSGEKIQSKNLKIFILFENNQTIPQCLIVLRVKKKYRQRVCIYIYIYIYIHIYNCVRVAGLPDVTYFTSSLKIHINLQKQFFFYSFSSKFGEIWISERWMILSVKR